MMEMLPPEFQQELDMASRRQKLAQLLQERGMNLQAPQAQGAQAARISPLAGILTALQGGAGAFLGNKAEQDMQNVRTRFNQAETADVAKMQGLPEPEAIKAGQLSQFNRSRELAKTMQTQAEKRRELSSGVYKEAGQVPQALATLNGAPVPESTGPKAPEVNWITGPDGKQIPQQVNFDKFNIPKATLGSLGSTTKVDVNLPKEEGKMVVGQIGKTLDERRTRADAARQTYSAANQALDALEQGAKAGGGEAFKQTARKAAQAFGITLPETASTEQLSQALLQGVIGQAKNLRPASDTDLKILNNMAGSVGTDPTALTKALAFAQSMALQDLDQYNRYAGENEKSLDPSVKALFSGATSGFELPKTLPGPLAYQMEIVRQLQRQGMDISKFADPSGKPFDPASKFNINPTAGFAGVADRVPQKPAAAPQFEEGKIYVDGNGNKAKFQGGQWVPVQ